MDVSINTRLIASLSKSDTLDFKNKLLSNSGIKNWGGIETIFDTDFIAFCYLDSHLIGFGTSHDNNNYKFRRYLKCIAKRHDSPCLQDIKINWHFEREVILESCMEIPFVGVFSLGDTERRKNRSLIDKGFIFLGEASFHN